MELRRDLLKMNEKSRLRIVLGIVFSVFAVTWFVVRKMEYDDILPFDWIYSGIFILLGLMHTVEGFGYSFSTLFGNAFILIDQNTIRIKTRLFEKEQFISWIEVASIDYKPGILQFTKRDQTMVALKLSNLDYYLIQEIKEVIDSNAKEKGIATSF